MNAAPKPTILFVHGSWHNPLHFTPIRTVFEKAGYPTSCPSQRSCDSLPSVGLKEDAECITSELSKLVEVETKDVIIIAHSYGGVVATQATQASFGRKVRDGEGKKGGVVNIVYMCAFLLEKNQSLAGAFGWREGDPLPPFLIVDDNKMCTMADPEQRFYNDLPEQERKKWTEMLVANASHTQTTTTSYEAYRHHPVTYLFCENDHAMPLEVQKYMVEKIRAKGVTVQEETCGAGHSPQLAMPERVLEVVQKIELHEGRCR